MNMSSGLNKIVFSTGKINKWLWCDFWLCFAFTKPVILGVKFTTESNRQSFKLELESRDLSLFLITFMQENDCSHLYIVPKRQAWLWANFLIFGNCSHGNDCHKPIISDALGNDESLSNFIFNTEFAISSNKCHLHITRHLML